MFTLATAHSDTQAMTALGAASTDDGAAAAGAHAHKETVGTLTTYDGRLISPFHGALTLERNARLHRPTPLLSTLFSHPSLWITLSELARMRKKTPHSHRNRPFQWSVKHNKFR